MNISINNYRFAEFEERYFLTTDHGSHCFLDEEEFKMLKNEEFDPALKGKLLDVGVLLDEGNFERVVGLTRKRNSFLFQGPSLHIIVVTLRCNMNCIYCHASSKGKTESRYDMDTETAKRTVDFIFKSSSKNIRIEFQGGEPLLNWKVVEYIIEYSLEKNKQEKKDLSFSIVTNMAEMDEEKKEYLIERDVGVCASLDGPKELHDSNRKFLGGSNYEQVVQWIKRFGQGYDTKGKTKKVNALVTLTKKSLNMPKEIVNEYVRLAWNQSIQIH